MADLIHGGIDYIGFLAGLGQVLRPRSYFEIGTNTGNSLLAFGCDALCIDPEFQVDRNPMGSRRRMFWFQMTSDEFFRDHTIRHYLPGGPDVAFLDGMHRFEYLLRDFIKSERECHERSMILLHDCLPTNLRMAERVPRDDPDDPATRGFWTGDVWRLLPILRKWRPDIRVIPLDCPPTGLVVCTNLNPDSTILRQNYQRIVEETLATELADFGLDRLWEEFRPINSRGFIEPPYNLTALFSIA